MSPYTWWIIYLTREVYEFDKESLMIDKIISFLNCALDILISDNNLNPYIQVILTSRIKLNYKNLFKKRDLYKKICSFEINDIRIKKSSKKNILNLFKKEIY